MFDDLYLAYCEAAFLERHAGDFQLLLVKNGTSRALFNEPWEKIGVQESKQVASGF
jgi:hypothetical protein